MEQRATLTLLADRFAGLRCVDAPHRADLHCCFVWAASSFLPSILCDCLPGARQPSIDRHQPTTQSIHNPRSPAPSPSSSSQNVQWLRRGQIGRGQGAAAAAEPGRDQQPPRGPDRVYIQVRIVASNCVLCRPSLPPLSTCDIGISIYTLSCVL